MGKLIGKIALFLAGILVLCCLCIVLSSCGGVFDDFFATVSSSEEYTPKEETQKIDAINSAKETDNKYTKLIVGDSVSYFMFTQLQEYNDNYLIASTSRPFTMAGQYMVIKQFADSHPNASEVYLFFSKDSWESVIDPQCGYQNTVVPFIEAGVYDDLEDVTKREIVDEYTVFFVNPLAVKLYYNSKMNHKLVLNTIIAYNEKILGKDCSKMYETTEGRLSPLSELYLQKTIDLCNEKGISLHLMHDPLADTDKKHAEMEAEKQDFINSGYMDIAGDYFDSVIFYPKEQFVDGVHYGQSGEMQKDAIRDIINKTGLMTDLVVK